MGIGAIIAVLLVVSAGVGSTGYAIVETGYGSAIPFIGFSTLETLTPTGNCSMLPINQLGEKYPKINKLLDEMPRIQEVKYSVYETEASVNDVVSNYHSRLSSKGYDLKYNGTLALFGIPMYYRGYLKGATAVGIVITAYIIGHDTVVLYTTGYGPIYRDDILPWIEEKMAPNTLPS